MDKPIELKSISNKEVEDIRAKDSGMDLSEYAKLKRKVPMAPAVEGHEAIVKLYNDYKNDVIRDQDPTDEQLAVLHGIAEKLLEK